MKITSTLAVIIIANLLFSTAGDTCAKIWGLTNNDKWFFIGFSVNLITVATFMLVVRFGGLTIATTVVLILTLIINASVGYVIFHEPVDYVQMSGIVLGIIAILLIVRGGG